jgi:Tol biopolymer transport system component
MKILPKATFCLLLCATTAVGHAQDLIDARDKPVLLAPGVISTAAGEFAPTFMPDGKTVYFTGDSVKIYESKWVNGQWSKPARISFTGPWRDMDPFLTPDGKRLYFSSYRPHDSSTENTPKKIAHVWYADRLAGGAWSAPHHLDAPVNLPGVNDYAPAISASQDLFVYSPNRDTSNRTTYYFKWLGDHYDAPKAIPINGKGGVHDPYISADERFLVFASGGDLYIAFRQANGWSDRIKFSPQVNDGRKKSSPSVSPDGKMLYYSSDSVNGILMIPIKIENK